ncbi:uncharacterized protein LOC142879648 [Nelusetta ayraudi]|uniref:uncharacterized protein LOC142879648 n=1 Tax=Nelusetta ayraudi TaxID=303726 RepID=UPI003F7299EF
MRMLQSKWILSLFFLTMLQFEAAITESTRRLVQAHSEATLPCENVKLGQKQCKGTTWIFLSKTSYVELFHYGEVTEDGKEKSDRLRLSLSENCSLGIKNVTAEDVGSYTCQQWRGTKESTGDTKLAENSVVYLSVVTVTEQWKNDLVRLNCSVSTVGDCPYTVKWQLAGGSDIDGQTSPSSCSASVEVWRPCDNGWSGFQPLRCRVMNKTGEEKKFFNPPSICETPAAWQNLIQHWHFYVGGAAAAFVAVVAAVVIGWKIKSNRRRKEKADIVAKEPEDVLSYVTISFTRSGTDANLHREDPVTYSTVRDASSYTLSPAVHVDSNALYAEINKP